jgi:AAA domain
MNVANAIITTVVLHGGIEKYLSLPDEPLFVGIDKAAWNWIKNSHAKNGITPNEEIFRGQFPESTYRFEDTAKTGRYATTDELIDHALERSRKTKLNTLVMGVIDDLDHDRLDQVEARFDAYIQAERAAKPSPFRMLNSDDLDDLDDPEMLIQDLIQAGTVNQLTGFWGTGKSFLALDWACCIATGRKWQGHKVKAGNVLYVAAEGGSGIKKRVRAWKNRHGVESTASLTVIMQPVQVPDRSQVSKLVSIIKDKNVSLVIFDTQQRCTSGMDENFVKDASSFIDGLNAVRDAIEMEGTTVLVVHHTGYDKSRGRGSTAVAAAMDGIFNIISTDPHQHMTLEHQKAKDTDTHDDIGLKLEGEGASCVVAEDDMPDIDTEKGTERMAVAELIEHAEDGKTSPEVQSELGMSQNKAQRILSGLVKDKSIVAGDPRPGKRAPVYRWIS